MKKSKSLFIILFIWSQIAVGKDQYKVIRKTYLKSNPDAYSDNLYYIPVGEVVAKDVSSDYPFIMITYKGEIGYVSLNDLAPLIKSENIDEIIEDTPHVFIKQDFTNQDLEEESKVKNSSIGTVEKTNEFKFNSNNKHNRDKRIEFYSEQHIYTIDKIPAVSVSTIIDKFFPVFDTKYWAAFKAPSLHMSPSAVEKMWKDKGELSIIEGKKLHDQIENYFINKIKTDSKEFKLFESFLKENPNIEPYRTEWRIFDEKYLIAGTIDLVSKNKHEYEIYDWKRSHRIISLRGEPIDDLGFGKFGSGKLSHISDSPFNRYCMQQSMYKFILEKNYGINIKAMYLVVLHPDYNTFYKIPVPYYKTEIEFILNSI